MSFHWTTFAFQLVNVVVLLAILQRFLFRPLADVIARRQAQTAAAVQAADAAKAQAEMAARQAEAETQATLNARQQLLAAAQADAQAQRAELLTQARAEAARIVAEGQALAEQDAAARERRTWDHARALAAGIATRALGAQPTAPEGYAQRLADALQSMPGPERQALLAGGHLRLVAPRPLTDDQWQAARQALTPWLADALPAPVTDPALIAGLELCSDTGAVRNSLAHDLERIAKAMRNDTGTD
ncbi:F0F1 ATP synthase subunit B [Pseudacidovorax intermedius]|uniref:F0F1 ATP synthase subunit B family protein n=1 Tax=Pseudacidovorax intermedius TaxID=433924 RepID=UPI0026EAE418|nr:F0F1 ATP synthase subunit B [Pseudacidovorax intermedius]